MKEKVDQLDDKNLMARVSYLKGASRVEEGDYQKAIEFFNIAIENDPEFLEAWFEMGVCYSKLGNLIKVIECNEKVVEINPQFKDAWNLLGNAYMIAENYPKAITCFKKLLTLDPDLVSAWESLAIANEKLGNYEIAIKCHEIALENRPNDVNILNNLAADHGRLENHQKVIEYSKKVTEVAPLNKRAWFNLGLANMKLGNELRSLECFKRVNRIDPQDERVSRLIDNLEKEVSTKAVQLDVELEKPIETSPQSKPTKNIVPKIEASLGKDAKKMYTLGNMFFNSGNYEKAIIYFQKIVTISPEFKDAWHKLAISYGRLGDFKKMVECSENADNVSK